MRVATSATMVAVVAGSAAGQLQITEVYTGISGEDGTVDWFEVTNTSGDTVDTGSFFYDDESADIGDAGQLDSILLGAGETAVFLISDDNEPDNDADFGTAIEEFEAIWGDIVSIGLTNGGGGLSQNGDAVNILNADGDVLEDLAFTGDLAGDLLTIEDTNDGLRQSVLGENGAFESNAFFNDNLGLPNNQATLVGSPGLIPAPGSLALLGLGGVAATRRRR